MTVCLEGRCSIQLSYAPLVLTKKFPKELKKSGRQDSNLRPPGPKPGAMTGLRYAPRELSKVAEGVGFEPTRPLQVDSLANCSVNHSGNPPLQLFYELLFCNCECKYIIVLNIYQNFLLNFFCIFGFIIAKINTRCVRPYISLD